MGVDIPQGFHEEGFLSSGITDSIAGLRSENSEWFNLTFDMNSALTRLATEAMGLIRTTLMSPEAIAVRLLLRACGTIQGVILLTERGMVTEGRTLTRNLLETAFCVAALTVDPSEFVRKLEEDHSASKLLQNKFIVAQGFPIEGFTRDELQAAIVTMDKGSNLGPKKLAEGGPLKSYT